MEPQNPQQFKKGSIRRSSSRSPSLSRRPSLHDKGGSGISKPKKKSSGTKKERWLLTRKTWRYWTDVMGKEKPRSTSPTTPLSRRPSSSQSTPATPTTITPITPIHTVHSYSTGIVPAGHGYTPTLVGIVSHPQPWPLPGPSHEKRTSVARSSICSGTGSLPTEDNIPALEANFEQACHKEKKFLLWTRSKPKGLSGPALREFKQREIDGGRTRNSSSSSSVAGRTETPETPRPMETMQKDNFLEYYSPEDEDLMDDYDEYDLDKEQMTVREIFPSHRESSSGASSIVSLVSAGLSFWRSPPPSYSESDTGVGRKSYHRNIGVQTEPLSEDSLAYIQTQLALEESNVDPTPKPEMMSTDDQLPEIQDDEGISDTKPSPSEISSGGGGLGNSSSGDKKSDESGYSSSSISNTVMRYLRMVRKNSKSDTSKEMIDKFKTVNYDRSLRDIKSKNVTVEEALEHEKKKALQQQGPATVTPPSTMPPPSSVSPHPIEKSNSKTESAKTVKRTPSILCMTKKGKQQVMTGSKIPGSHQGNPDDSSVSTPTSRTSPFESCSSPEVFSSPPLSPPPVQLISTEIQTGESLIRFLKNFKPIRKFSEVSSSLGSSESAGDATTSPRYSITTGSDMSYFPEVVRPFDLDDDTPTTSYHRVLHSPYCHSPSTRDDGLGTSGYCLSYSPKMSTLAPRPASSSSIGPPHMSPKFYPDYSTTPSPSSSSNVSPSRPIPTTYLSPTSSTVPPPIRTTVKCSSSSRLLSRSPTGNTPPGGGGFAESISSFINRHSGVIGRAGRSKAGSDTSVHSSSGKVDGATSGTGLVPRTDSTLSLSSSLVMQKSKSSSSVFHGHGGGEKRGSTSSTTGTILPGSSPGSRLISKTRIFKSKSSKNTGRSTPVTCLWTPQGKGAWINPGGRQLTLEGTSVLSLGDKELEALQQVALAKLQALNLGTDIKIPREKLLQTEKPKRRTYLLRKKALSTGLVDTPGQDVAGSCGSGQVFRIPLTQCIQNDRQRGLGGETDTTKRFVNGSRCRASSVYETTLKDKTGSVESLIFGGGKRGSSGGFSGSTGDILGENIPMDRGGGGGTIPAFVKACISYLEAKGLHTLGIFRVSPNLRKIRQLREEIDSGQEIVFGDEHTPHEAAALLKEFLRDLPEPLLCRDLYKAFLNTQKMLNRRLQLEAIQYLIQLLPTPNRDTLAAILGFFAKVAENASDREIDKGEILKGNKMESYNLATLIAPNILPCISSNPNLTSSGNVKNPNPPITSNTETRERQESIDVVNYMITNHQHIFDVSAENLDEMYTHLLESDPDLLEIIFKHKAGEYDLALDDLETTSSVFEGSEPGETWEGDDSFGSRRLQKREDILHKDGGKGGQPHHKSGDGGTGKCEKSRNRRDGSKDRTGGETDKQHSGGESDSSSTKSTSRWFRRARPDNKPRTSSDSGSEKVKAKRRDSSLGVTKRASSLDSVSLKETCPLKIVTVTETVDRQRSCSDQNLKVPESLNRRQSSPVLEGPGIITASLKIPVPLNIDDSDIPYIEEENHHHHPHHVTGQQRLILKSHDRPDETGKCGHGKSSQVDIQAKGGTNGQGAARKMSTISQQQIASPPGSPPIDTSTFPYEELTGRFLIGCSPQLTTPIGSTTTVVTKSKLSHLPSVGTLRVLPVETSLVQSASTAAISTGEPRPPVGRETKGANVGLIKSKTADFEKFVKEHQSRSPAASSIASNLRLRSQGNIQLKQEFLLRQQQQQQQRSSISGPSASGPSRSSSGTLNSGGTGAGTSSPSHRKVISPSSPQTPGTTIRRSEIIASRPISRDKGSQGGTGSHGDGASTTS